MKKVTLPLLLLLLMGIFVGCKNNSKLLVDKELLAEQQKLEEKATQLEKARDEVVRRFKHERDVLGTGKFIEDTYKTYPDDLIIATIYYYDNAVTCSKFYKDSKNVDWLSRAKSYASKIDPSYSGEFNSEIIPFVSGFLGSEWDSIRKQTLQLEAKFNALTSDDKKEIYKFIQSRYDYYDKKDGKNTGDKYSDTIWEEVATKYGIAKQHVGDIWGNIDIISSVGQDIKSSKTTNISYDATLSYNGGKALIAVSESVMDRYFKALVNKNQGTIDELYNELKVAQVPAGTPVNIIERKLSRVKVKILDGVYSGNEVWVLVESVHEK